MGYVIPGRDGMGAGGLRKFFRRRRRRRPPPKVCFFGKICFLRFVTHSRAMNFLAAAYESDGRGGIFIVFHEFMTIQYFVEIFKNVLQKLWVSLFGRKKKAPAGTLPVAPNVYIK